MVELAASLHGEYQIVMRLYFKPVFGGQLHMIEIKIRYTHSIQATHQTSVRVLGGQLQPLQIQI